VRFLTESNSCCLCGADYGRYGHNPDPVSSVGRCCDTCNATVVIPARLAMMGFRAEERKEIEARMLEIEDMENPSAEDLDNLEALESRYFELTGTFGSEEGFTPTHPPMEFGEMVDWRPLDGTPSLKRQRAEDDGDGIQMEHCESCQELTDVEELYTSADDMIICDECYTIDMSERDHLRHVAIEYDAEGIPEQYKNMSLDELAELDIQELAENFDIATLIELRIEAAKQEAPYWESKGIDFDVENESFVGMPSGIFQEAIWQHYEYGAEDSGFPTEAIQELKRNIVVFTGGAMMLSFFTAIGGFLLGRKTKEC